MSAKYHRHEVHTDALPNTKRDERDGFIRGDVICAIAGVLPYPQRDGTTRWELAHPEDLFSSETLDSARLIPVTNDHPELLYLEDGSVDPDHNGLVNAGNADILSIGSTGDTPRRDGKNLVVSYCIQQADAIFDVEQGRRELSMGYRYRLEPESGVFEGVAYTHRKRDIRFNHMAIVDAARVGPAARISLDGKFVNVNLDSAAPLDGLKGRSMKIIIKGIEYEAAPEVVNALRDAEAKIAQDAAEHKTALDSVSAERDTLKADKTKLEKKVADLPVEIKTAMDAAAKVKTKAAKILTKDEMTALDASEPVDVMKAAILKDDPEAELDGKSDDYIKARFDGIKPASASEDDDEPGETAGDSIANQRRTMAGGKGGNDDDRETKLTGRDAMVERMKNAAKIKKG